MNNIDYQNEYKNAINNLKNSIINKEITWDNFNEELKKILTTYNKKYDNEFANKGIHNEFDSTASEYTSDSYKTNLKGISSNPYIDRLDKDTKSNLEKMISRGDENVDITFKLINSAYTILSPGTYINTPQK